MWRETGGEGEVFGLREQGMKHKDIPSNINSIPLFLPRCLHVMCQRILIHTQAEALKQQLQIPGIHY